MEQESLPAQVKKLEKYINTLPHAKNLNMLSRAPREAMITLRDSIFTARQAVDLYFGSDDTKEQLMALETALSSLKVVGIAIMDASQYDLLDVADVAHLSALNEYIVEQLR
jgi:hypothetical protein